MSDPTWPLFPVAALSGAVLVLIPLPWHLLAWNAGTCLFMLWVSVACLNLGVNAIVWHGNAIDHAPVWCDISRTIIVAVSSAIPATVLCIVRRLYSISTMTKVTISREDKRRAVIVDLCIGLGIPLLQIPCQYVVSGHRFDILEDVGCYPFTYNVALAYPLSTCWPLALGLVTAVYAVLTLRAFLRRRASFRELAASHPSLTPNRYLRLFALAGAALGCTVPICAWGTALSVRAGLHPWVSWASVHAGYARVDVYPAVLWRLDPDTVAGIELTRWSTVFCAFVFFALFGFAEEARRHYRLAFRALGRRFGVQLRTRRSAVAPEGHLRCIKRIPVPLFASLDKLDFDTLPRYTTQLPVADMLARHDSPPSSAGSCEKAAGDTLTNVNFEKSLPTLPPSMRLPAGSAESPPLSFYSFDSYHDSRFTEGTVHHL